MVKKFLFLTILSFGIIPPTIAQKIPSYIPTNGLVGWWPFNGNANDESGNGNNGTVNGATLTADRNGKANSAYSFDGVDDFIQTNINQINNGPFTITFWTKINVWKTSGFVSSRILENNSTGIFIYDNNLYLTLDKKNVNEVIIDSKISTNIINLNKWKSITYTFDGINVKLYLDGIINFTYSLVINNSDLDINKTFLFGKDNCCGNRCLSGQLDDIAIYNRALTEQEIKQLYQEGKDSIKYIDKDNRIERIKTITLPNVQFFTNSDQLLSSSRQDLDDLAKYLFENPNSNAEIIGHTDNVGDFQKNMKLSLDRANSVKKYLKEKGIDAIRINAIGKGPTEPKESNDTPEGRLMNRRVEVKISQQTRN